MMVHRLALKGNYEMVNVLVFESELDWILTGTILTSMRGKDKRCSHKHISNLKVGKRWKIFSQGQWCRRQGLQRRPRVHCPNWPSPSPIKTKTSLSLQCKIATQKQSRLCKNLIKISHDSQHLCSFVCAKKFHILHVWQQYMTLLSNYPKLTKILTLLILMSSCLHIIWKTFIFWRPHQVGKTLWHGYWLEGYSSVETPCNTGGLYCRVFPVCIDISSYERYDCHPFGVCGLQGILDRPTHLSCGALVGPS